MAKEDTHSSRKDARVNVRFIRIERAASEELDALLRDELEDPDLQGVEMAYLELASNMRSARVFVRVPGDPERAERALERATPMLRTRLQETLQLKFALDLRFRVSALGDEDDYS